MFDSRKVLVAAGISLIGVSPSPAVAVDWPVKKPNPLCFLEGVRYASNPDESKLAQWESQVARSQAQVVRLTEAGGDKNEIARWRRSAAESAKQVLAILTDMIKETAERLSIPADRPHRTYLLNRKKLLESSAKAYALIAKTYTAQTSNLIDPILRRRLALDSLYLQKPDHLTVFPAQQDVMKDTSVYNVHRRRSGADESGSFDSQKFSRYLLGRNPANGKRMIPDRFFCNSENVLSFAGDTSHAFVVSIDNDLLVNRGSDNVTPGSHIDAGLGMDARSAGEIKFISETDPRTRQTWIDKVIFNLRSGTYRIQDSEQGFRGLVEALWAQGIFPKSIVFKQWDPEILDLEKQKTIVNFEDPVLSRH